MLTIYCFVFYIKVAKQQRLIHLNNDNMETRVHIIYSSSMQ